MSLWFQKCITLGVWQCPDIPNIPDIQLFLKLRTFPTVSNFPIIQIRSSLWFQKCITLGFWQCSDIPNIAYIPDISLFQPLRTFPKVSNIPIIQIRSSLWFLKCMTLASPDLLTPTFPRKFFAHVLCKLSKIVDEILLYALEI